MLLQRFNSKIFEIGCYLLVFAFLLFPGRYVWLGYLFLIGYLIFRKLRAGSWLPKTNINLPIAVFFVTAVIGVLISPAPALSFNRLTVLILGIITYFFFYDLTGNGIKPLSLAIGAALGGLSLAVFGLFVTDWRAGSLFLIDLSSVIPLAFELQGSGVPSAATSVHPRTLAGVLAMITPVSLALALPGQRRGVRVLGGMSILVMMIPLVLSQSPQAYLAIALAVAFQVSWRYPKSRWGFVAIGIIILTIWVKWQWGLPPTVVARLLDGVQARFQFWHVGALMLVDMPFTGSGLNAFPVVAETFYLPLNYHMSHAHNLFLQTGIDHGIFGFIAFMIIVLLSLQNGFRAVKFEQHIGAQTILMGFVGAIIAFIGFGIFDSISLGNKVALFVWITMSVLNKMNPQPTDLMHKIRAKGWLSWNIRLVGLGLIGVVIFAFLFNLSLVNWGRVALHRSVLSENNSERFTNRIKSPPLPLFSDRVHVLIGVSHAVRGDYQTAIEKLTEATQKSSANVDADYHLAKIFTEQNRVEEAAQYWRKLPYINYPYRKGEDALRNGDLHQAKTWLTVAHQANPDTPGLNWLMAELFYELSKEMAIIENYDEALYYAKQALEQSPSSSVYIVWLGDLYLQQELFTEALAQYDRALTLNVDSTWVWRIHLQRASVFVQQNEWDSAVQAYQTAFAMGQKQNISPETSITILTLLAQAYQQIGQTENAMDTYLQVLEFDPDNQFAKSEIEKLTGE